MTPTMTAAVSRALVQRVGSRLSPTVHVFAMWHDTAEQAARVVHCSCSNNCSVVYQVHIGIKYISTRQILAIYFPKELEFPFPLAKKPKGVAPAVPNPLEELNPPF